MKKFILFVLSTIVCNIALLSAMPHATNKVRAISDSAKFYLVTCEPGDAVYARFGHSGLRVYDAENDIDEVFHWGLFSFDTPNFIGRFISGNTDYEMGVFGTRYFMREYIHRGSSVYAQELDLSAEQKHELWAKLWTNYRPENRKYRYNFIYDNCATRPYQLIISTYNYDIVLKHNLNQISYRDIINQYVPIGSMLNTGINLIIGNNADKYITTTESMAFPIYTMEALAHAYYTTSDGQQKSIVKQHSSMHKVEPKNFEVSPFVYYTSIFIPLLLAAICMFYTYKRKRYIPFFTHLMLFVSGLVGIVISYLWFFSQHPLVSDNMNLLWCNPLNIILAILLAIHSKSLRTAKFVLSAICYLLSLLFLIMLIFGVQETTVQIFSIWVLMFTLNHNIAYTYSYKIKNLLRKLHKK